MRMRRSLTLWMFVLPYIGIMCLFLLRMQYQYAFIGAILPFGLAVLYQFVFHLSRYLMLVVFFIPMSINVRGLIGDAAMSLPFEPLLLLAGGGTLILLILRKGLNLRWTSHPISLVILIQLVWLGMTTLSSSYQLISFKMILARLAYLTIFYAVFSQMFIEGKNALRFLWVYLLGFLPVIIFSLSKLSTMGLARKFSPEMARPFYDDHTLFGACLAMLFPVAWVIWANRKSWLNHLPGKRLSGLVFLMVTFGIALSFSRAAWMSVFFAGGMYLLFKWRVPFKGFVLAFLLIAAAAGLGREAIWDSMQKNENVSGDDLMMTAKSVTNVTSDESNRERVNRWSCAVRMSYDRPWLGFGPGTYERNYGPYQLLNEKTRISSAEGDRGDAHSEYLTALSEQGWPGLIIWLTLLFTILYCGMRVIYRSPHADDRKLAIGVMLGLLTYYLHGMVNSFLDIDKAAPLFWGMAAVIVALDLRRSVPLTQSPQSAN